MLSDVMKILRDNTLCVLSTCSNDIPNASLMQYICDDGCSKLCMLTLKGSVKYSNIANNANVSLLIDTRTGGHEHQTPVKAVTITGHAVILDNEETAHELIGRLAQKYGNLANLAADPNVCIIEAAIRSFLFLESAHEGHQINIADNRFENPDRVADPDK